MKKNLFSIHFVDICYKAFLRDKRDFAFV